MKQAHKKRSSRATANSPLGLPDMGKLLYKSEEIFKLFYLPHLSPLPNTLLDILLSNGYWPMDLSTP